MFVCFVLSFSDQRALTIGDLELGKLVSWAVYEFSGAAITKYHRLGDFNNRNLFSHTSGGWRQV